MGHQQVRLFFFNVDGQDDFKSESREDGSHEPIEVSEGFVTWYLYIQHKCINKKYICCVYVTPIHFIYINPKLGKTQLQQSDSVIQFNSDAAHPNEQQSETRSKLPIDMENHTVENQHKLQTLEQGQCEDSTATAVDKVLLAPPTIPTAKGPANNAKPPKPGTVVVVGILSTM